MGSGKVRLPELPIVFPNDPDAEQEVGDGMRGHGVAEAILPEDQALVGAPAQERRQPLVVGKTEDGRARNPVLCDVVIPDVFGRDIPFSFLIGFALT